MDLDLHVSYGQRFGPMQVAINLLENFLNMRKLSILGVVDSEVAKTLSNRRHIHVPKNSLNMILTLFIIFLKDCPRICHFNFPPLYLTPLLFLMKIPRVRMVYSFHGGILFEHKGSWNKSLFIIQCKYFYDVIVANSRYSASKLLKVDRRLMKKIVIIPNGVQFKIHPEPIATPIKGDPAVLYVGRIEYIKGTDILLQAVALVKKTLKEIHLHIAGSGSKLGEIRALISSLGIKENVALHGFVDGKEKNALYLSSDVVVVPSRDETFGFTVLEAMAAGKPLIVSNRGALPELVKHNHNGLVTNLEPEALAQALIELTKNKKMMAYMSEVNRKTVKLYEWKRISEKYVAMYRNLQSKRS